MANISLEDQIFFTLPAAADPTSSNRNPNPSPARCSQQDPILISSDDESDYGNLDDGNSDTSLPPLDELCRRAGQREAGSVTGPGHERPNIISSTAGDSDTVESPLAQTPGSDGKTTLSQQQATLYKERTSASFSHSPPPLLEPSDLIQANQGPSSTTDNHPTPCEIRETSIPEMTIRDEVAEELPRTSPTREEVPQSPSSSRVSEPSSPLQESMNRESTRRNSAGDGQSESESDGGSDGHGEAEPSTAQSRLRRKRAALGRLGLRFPSADNPNFDDEEEEAQSIGRAKSQRNAGRRRLGGTDDEDAFQPRDSDDGLDEDGEDNVRPPPRKRRKGSFLPPTACRRATGRATPSDNADTRSRQAETKLPSQKSWSRRGIPSPPTSRGSSEEEIAGAPIAKFEEWPLQDVVLKRVTASDVVTFQLEFSWDLCGNHRHKDRAQGGQQRRSFVKRRSSTADSSASKGTSYTPEEDKFLKQLKEENDMSWKEIHRQFTETFPRQKRSVGTLQVRYCTKLKGRTSSRNWRFGRIAGRTRG